MFLITKPAFSSNITEINVVGEGTGITEEIATRNALANAVSKTGLEISISSELNTQLSQSADSNGNEHLAAMQKRSETTKLSSNGDIKSWEKISVKKIEGNHYSVKVSAILYDYKQIPSSKRLKIALLPVESSVSNTIISSSKKLETLIQNSLVQSRRFAVLTRSDVDKVLVEQNFLAGNNVKNKERARLGNLLGADVILSLKISELKFSEKKETIAITGQNRTVRTGLIKIDASIFDTATGQIRFSQSFSSTINSSVSSLDELLNDVSRNAINKIVLEIYPLRIIQVVDNQTVFLNTGGSLIRDGMVLDVYSQGETLKDPYTGELLGSIEKHVGVIEVTRVESKFSVARILSGDEFSPMMIARESNKPPLNNDINTKNSKSNAGVRLPFD